MVLVANRLFTLWGIMPTNHVSMAIEPALAGPDGGRLIGVWGWPHALRSLLAGCATLIFPWASLR